MLKSSVFGRLALSDPPRPTLTAMADDQEWLFDAVLGFLRSPAWALPVMSFIDDNCVVFDSGAPPHPS